MVHGMKRDLARLMRAIHSSDPEPLGLRGSPHRLGGHPFSAASSRLDPVWRRHLSTTRAATGRRNRSRPRPVRVRPCIRRAGRVASRYVRLPFRPCRDRLCRPARPPLDLVQDVPCRPTTRAERAAECCGVHHGTMLDGPGLRAMKDLWFLDGSVAAAPQL